MVAEDLLRRASFDAQHFRSPGQGPAVELRSFVEVHGFALLTGLLSPTEVLDLRSALVYQAHF